MKAVGTQTKTKVPNSYLLMAPTVSLHSFLFMARVVLLSMVSGFCCVVGSVHGVNNETDRLALLAFKAEITSDPFGALSSWNGSNHFCQWVGVTCGHRHRRVTVLDLNHQKLTGHISSHIGNLSFLREIWLRNNSLSQKIPSELGRLRRLRIVSLSNNSITGEIPANLSGCSNLYVLELSGNKLTGQIPKGLGQLSKLEELYISQNNLAGVLPSTIGNLSSLTTLTAAVNNITGNIPHALRGLTNLVYLGLGENRLNGTIPSSFFNLSSIKAFDFGVNQIQGSLPSSQGITLSNLEFLEVGQNLFTGSIPISIANATKLYHLAFSGNKFTGKVPPLEKLHALEFLGFHGNYLGTGKADDLSFLDSLTNATNLYILDLAQNKFGGVLPQSISNFSNNLGILNLDSNEIFGSIPSSIQNLVNLQGLDMSKNHLTGNIPVDIGKLQKLQMMILWGNSLDGEIPSSVSNLTLLTLLSLSENNLHGSIPSSIGKCQFLEQLFLSNNNLSGTIPNEVGRLSSLFALYLTNNNLAGSLAVEVGHLINLEEFSVSENMMSGIIPSTLGSCVKLTVLNLKGNKFWGVIPSSFHDLRGLEELDLSYNNFSGKIPEYLEGFVFLQILNMSFNDFEGAVPETGLFKNATAISVVGNNKLCGGIPELRLQSCTSKGFRKKKIALAWKLIIPTSTGFLGLILLSCFLCFCCSRKTTNVPSFKVEGNSFMRMSYQSLVKATQGFSPANLIGVGSFGSVYKGILDQGGKVVVVKVLNLDFRGASKSFIAECRALKCIRHRNLVKLLTACSSIDYHGNDFKALIYEFMVNGSLEEWLHPNENKDDPHEESRNLSLFQRLNVAIDVASALDYLHHHCPETIVHCDLKPSNILLDDEMIGHVGDFGLARLLLEAASANQSSSIGIRGSVGYAAPEYGMGNEVSTSGDVYSYGILLLEMFIGKRPTDSMFSHGLTLHEFAKTALPERVANVADPMLFEQREIREASSSGHTTRNQSSPSSHKIQECLISVLQVGINCSQVVLTDRPNITDVVSQLHLIRNTLLETAVHGGRRAHTAV